LPLAPFFVNNRIKYFRDNNFVNELSGAGIYEFGAAFWHNEIDYATYYPVKEDKENFSVLRQMLSDSVSKFSNDFRVWKDILFHWSLSKKEMW
jgi:hypothetical protein